MLGIDVSSHDRWPFKPNTEGAYRESDFLIAKATEGTGYVNPHFARAMGRAEADGKLLGFYHYASGGDPVAEAGHMLSVASPWVGKAVPCLDWEEGGNGSWGDASWCRRFCEAVHDRTGVWPMVYVQASAIWQAASCHPECPLWVAGYPDLRNSFDVPRFRYGTGPWDGYAVWQFSSSGGQTDRDVSGLSRDEWRAMCGGAPARNTAKEEEDMPINCVLQLDDRPCLTYFDGHELRDAGHPDEIGALNQAYRAAVGRDIPCLKLGTKRAPWGKRLSDLLARERVVL